MGKIEKLSDFVCGKKLGNIFKERKIHLAIIPFVEQLWKIRKLNCYWVFNNKPAIFF